MAVEREDAARELRLEGTPLFAVGALIVAVICGAFFAGRWVERREHASRPVTVADQPGPQSQVVEPRSGSDAGADADFFDRVDGTKPQEPQREARKVPPVVELPPTPSSAGAAAAEFDRADEPSPAGGAFFVQVFAGHDRAAARQVIDRLKGEGYQVRLFDESGTAGAILRVRVGGYPSEDRARTIAGNLRQSGYSDAFVTRVD
jgi:hypothetical protein